MFSLGAISDGVVCVQVGFLVLTGIGFLIPLTMADPNQMIRTDGTRVTTPRQPSWKTELYGLYIALRLDPLIILLFPMFFASNWFYAYRRQQITPTYTKLTQTQNLTITTPRSSISELVR